jgi:hypothetical protein
VADALALIDLDGMLIDRDRGFALWASAFVAQRDLGDGALTCDRGLGQAEHDSCAGDTSGPLHLDKRPQQG